VKEQFLSEQIVEQQVGQRNPENPPLTLELWVGYDPEIGVRGSSRPGSQLVQAWSSHGERDHELPHHSHNDEHPVHK
jgi:hypothetical protein